MSRRTELSFRPAEDALAAADALPARVASLFILPAEIGIESGGVRAALPRAEARADVNELLARLGPPPIA